METLFHEPFYVMVTNTSKVPIRVSKNIKAATLGDILSEMVPVEGGLPAKRVKAM